jgi:hypothetical protein
MKNFHVVAVSTRGYALLASYKNRQEAIQDALTRNRRSYSIVLRDGTTGKRYCIAELEKGA